MFILFSCTQQIVTRHSKDIFVYLLCVPHWHTLRMNWRHFKKYYRHKNETMKPSKTKTYKYFEFFECSDCFECFQNWKKFICLYFYLSSFPSKSHNFRLMVKWFELYLDVLLNRVYGVACICISLFLFNLLFEQN